MRVAFLTRYDVLGASSRVRATQYLPALAAAGIEATQLPLLTDAYLTSVYKGRRPIIETFRCYARRLTDLKRFRRHDLWWIEKELLPYMPTWFEVLLLSGKPYVLDLDDAIFHNYDLSESALVRRILGRKVDRLMAGAKLVTVGNGYLRDRALQAGASRVEVLPSVIDLARYQQPSWPNLPTRLPTTDAPQRPLRIVWIGSPATVHYLERVREPLRAVARQFRLELRVIGARAPSWPGVETRAIAWSALTEVAEIAACDVGIMPLDDTLWEQGKCSFKLVQFMACGLPVVASPVGMNNDVVEPGIDGFLADSTAQWQAALVQLALNPVQRHAMGRNGRRKVEQHYCLQITGPKLARMLLQAAD